MKRLNRNQILGLSIIAVALLILMSRGGGSLSLLSLVAFVVYAAIFVLIVMFLTRLIRAVWRLGAPKA